MKKLTYREAFDLAKTVRSNLPRLYRDGVERAAALSAIHAYSDEALVTQMDEVFTQYEIRSPHWDGSIA